MTFKLEFETDNAASEEYRAEEVSRILSEVADRVANGLDDAGTIHDINGNRIGQYAMTEETGAGSMKLAITVPDDDDADDNLNMMMQIAQEEIAKGVTSGKIGDMAWDLQETGA